MSLSMSLSMPLPASWLSESATATEMQTAIQMMTSAMVMALAQTDGGDDALPPLLRHLIIS